MTLQKYTLKLKGKKIEFSINQSIPIIIKSDNNYMDLL